MNKIAVIYYRYFLRNFQKRFLKFAHTLSKSVNYLKNKRLFEIWIGLSQLPNDSIFSIKINDLAKQKMAHWENKIYRNPQRLFAHIVFQKSEDYTFTLCLRLSKLSEISYIRLKDTHRHWLCKVTTLPQSEKPKLFWIFRVVLYVVYETNCSQMSLMKRLSHE